MDSKSTNSQSQNYLCSFFSNKNNPFPHSMKFNSLTPTLKYFKKIFLPLEPLHLESNKEGNVLLHN